jgi:hypothetical protein
LYTFISSRNWKGCLDARVIFCSMTFALPSMTLTLLPKNVSSPVDPYFEKLNFFQYRTHNKKLPAIVLCRKL